MASLSIAASQVAPVSGHKVWGIAGAAIAQGEVVYRGGDGKWRPAKCNGTAAEAGEVGYGLALSLADGDGRPIEVALPGAVVTLGSAAAPIPGTVYFVGATGGALVPAADLVAGTRGVPLCIGVGTDRVRILGSAYAAGAIVPGQQSSTTQGPKRRVVAV